MELTDGWFFFALPREAKPLLRRWAAAGRAVERRRGGPAYPSWSVGGARVMASGMGLARAHACAEAFLAVERPKWVITSGFAGALRPEWRAGRVAVDADPAFPWISALTDAGAVPARLISEPRVASFAADKAALRERTGADAVDMESEVIRRACLARGIPSATVRVVSDAADEDLPLDFNRLMRPDGVLSPWALAAAIAGRPTVIPKLIRFGRATAAAAEELARVLAAVG